MDRRSFLTGSSLAMTAALLPDRAEAATLIQGRALAFRERWQQQRQEVWDALFLDRPSAGSDPLAPLSEALGHGFGALSIFKDLELIPYEDQAHPAMQRLIREAAVAVGSALIACRELLEAFLAGEADEPEREQHLRGALRSIRLGLKSWSTNTGRQRQLEQTLASIEAEPERGTLLRKVRKEVSRLKRWEALSNELAQRGNSTGVVEVQDPEVIARVQAGQARWAAEGATDDAPSFDDEEYGESGGGRAAGGVLVMFLGTIGGLIVVLLGACMSSCGSGVGGVLVMLLGVAIIGLSIWGGINMIRNASTASIEQDELRYGPQRVRARHALAVVGEDGWIPTPVTRDGQSKVIVAGIGIVRSPGHWLADADGNAVAAGEDGLVPGAPVGALVGRVGDQTFFLGTEGLVPDGLAGPLELAINRNGAEPVKGHVVARLIVLEPDHA